MDLSELLRDDPKFHTRGGQPHSGWRLDDHTLSFLERHLRPGMKTIETGSGISTILFALKSATHTCITPSSAEIGRIKAYCAEKNLSLRDVTFINEPSERALPALTGGDYHVALIDGRHAFPTPFIDWYYMSSVLQPGGVLVVDDLHIWTCHLLTSYLQSEPDEWESLSETNRAAIFVKRRDVTYGEWGTQRFVRRRSPLTSKRARLERGLGLLVRGKVGLVSSLWFPDLTARTRRAASRLRRGLSKTS